jgi:hypothetical protein
MRCIARSTFAKSIKLLHTSIIFSAAWQKLASCLFAYELSAELTVAPKTFFSYASPGTDDILS